MRFLPLLLALANPSFPTAERIVDFPATTLKLREITAESVDALKLKIQAKVDAGVKDIGIIINSPGGSVEDGLDLIAFIAELQETKGLRTECLVDAQAASMAFIFLQSEACQKRYMTKRSILLDHWSRVHEMSGTAEELEEEAKELRAVDEAAGEIIIARLGITQEQRAAHIGSTAWVMTWKDALKYGAVDGVVK